MEQLEDGRMESHHRCRKLIAAPEVKSGASGEGRSGEDGLSEWLKIR